MGVRLLVNRHATNKTQTGTQNLESRENPKQQPRLQLPELENFESIAGTNFILVREVEHNAIITQAVINAHM